MTITTYSPEEAIQAAQAEGCIEIAEGVYLNSQESILADQADWGDEDGAKNMDFTKAPYWVTTNDGQVQPIYDANDEGLIDIIANA